MFHTKLYVYIKLFQVPLVQVLESASSATERKMRVLNSPQLDASSTVRPTGSRLVSLVVMASLIAQMACSKCYKTTCTLEETVRRGLNSHLKVSCKNCGHSMTAMTSPTTGGSLKTSEANLRVVASGRDCGIGFQKITKFFAGLDIPKPMHLKTYQTLAKAVGNSALQAARRCMEAAATTVCLLYRELDPFLRDGDNIPIVVSYDGTWHKRGHSSHYGVGVVIELHTGLVLDACSLSNFCLGCKLAPPKTSPLYKDWLQKHAPVCQCNHLGSANSMEVAAAKQIFARSTTKYGLEYRTVLCDGDAKTVASLNEAGFYEEEIIKEDCVNHVAKRIWTAMEQLKKKLQGTSESLTGKGKLTRAVQDKLAGYYASQLKQNAPDIEKMREGVYASLFHSVSTDDAPHHSHCPKGSESWCFYQRAVALKEEPRPHRPSLTLAVAEKLLPIYERLTQPDLLQRCMRMKTQNPNECFNAQVWRRCPKTEPTSLRTVETAVAMATLAFNEGPSGLGTVLEEMGIRKGDVLTAHLNASTKMRLKQAGKARLPSSVSKRRLRKSEKVRLQELNEAREGILYQAAAFNG